MKKIKFDEIINSVLFMYILSLYLFTYREGLFIISNIFAFLFVFMVIIRMFVNRGKIVINKYLIYHIVFISICTFSYIYAVNKSNVISEVRTLFLNLLVMVAIVNFIDTTDKIDWMIRSFIISGLISSIYIILISDFTNIIRYGSELGNQNAVGMMIGMSFIFSFSKYTRFKKKKNLLVLIPMIAVVLLTGSRKALMFIVFAILFITYYENNKKLKGKIKTLILGSAFSIIMFYVVIKTPLFYNVIGKRLVSMLAMVTGKGKVDNSAIVRSQMIDFGINLFKDKPILGYGARNYRNMFGEIHGIDRYAHNNFIELLVNIGIIGTFSYYLTNFKIVNDLYHYTKKFRDNDLAYPFIAIIIGYFLLGISLVYYDSKHFSFILALASVIPRVYSSNMEEEYIIRNL